jgi:hypothetical protein
MSTSKLLEAHVSTIQDGPGKALQEKGQAVDPARDRNEGRGKKVGCIVASVGASVETGPIGRILGAGDLGCVVGGAAAKVVVRAFSFLHGERIELAVLDHDINTNREITKRFRLEAKLNPELKAALRTAGANNVSVVVDAYDKKIFFLVKEGGSFEIVGARPIRGWDRFEIVANLYQNAQFRYFTRELAEEISSFIRSHNDRPRELIKK